MGIGITEKATKQEAIIKSGDANHKFCILTRRMNVAYYVQRYKIGLHYHSSDPFLFCGFSAISVSILKFLI